MKELNKTKECKWNNESIIIAILAKKFGKNGVLEFDLNESDIPKTLGINVENDKVFIYAE